MITSVTEERLLVISDIHLGNRLFRARRPVIEFFRYAYENDYSLCINGDGIDIVQSSIFHVTRDLLECTAHLRQFAKKGLNVYYTVGNHDMVLENFLDDWGVVRVTPFLNVTCGSRRVRIEHGHLYDDLYVRFPRLYTLMTVLGGMALRLHPRVYRAMESIRDMVAKILQGPASRERVPAATPAIPFERAVFREAAAEIARRGFDVVIFGHTHCPGQATLEGDKLYMNTGSWLYHPHFVELNRGEIRLKPVIDRDRGVIRESWTTLMDQLERRKAR